MSNVKQLRTRGFIRPEPAAALRQIADDIEAGLFGKVEALSARMWPTPTVRGNYNRAGLSAKSGDGLATAVKRWPTPSANDWKGSSKPGQRRGQLTDPAMGAIPAGGALNPTWVEWLMGFPLGWTVCEAWETRSSRRSRKS